VREQIKNGDKILTSQPGYKDVGRCPSGSGVVVPAILIKYPAVQTAFAVYLSVMVELADSATLKDSKSYG
jgi:hypothetical protein